MARFYLRKKPAVFADRLSARSPATRSHTKRGGDSPAGRTKALETAESGGHPDSSLPHYHAANKSSAITRRGSLTNETSCRVATVFPMTHHATTTTYGLAPRATCSNRQQR